MNGTHGELIWTPDEDTPDIVYYQVSYNVSIIATLEQSINEATILL